MISGEGWQKEAATAWQAVREAREKTEAHYAMILNTDSRSGKLICEVSDMFERNRIKPYLGENGAILIRAKEEELISRSDIDQQRSDPPYCTGIPDRQQRTADAGLGA